MTKKTASEARYRVLIAKADRLTDDECEELELVAQSMGLSLADVDHDTQLVKRIPMLAVSADEVEQLRHRMKDANKAIMVHNEKMEAEYKAALDHREDVLKPESRNAERAFMAANKAISELEELKRTHSRLFT